MFPRRRKLTAAVLALLAMLFMQATAAVAGCELPAGGGLAAMQASAMPDCHEVEEPPALCHAHCQGEDQAVGKVQPDLPDLTPGVSSIRKFEPVAEAPRPAALPRAFAGPPPRILFQSFLL